MFDLLVRGGTVVDPAQGLHAKLDVAVSEGKIAKVEAGIPATDASEVVDATGNYVTPGLIDIHVHVYRGDNHRDPDEVSGVGAGVTSLVDAGGPASDGLDDFRSVIVSKARTNIYCFLGVFNRSAGPWRELSVDGIAEAASANPDLVKGIKVHMMPVARDNFGLRHIEAAKAAAREAGIPVMLHIGDIGPRQLEATSPELTSAALDLLEAGDIVTHLFSPLTGSATGDGLTVLPALRAAKERGVWLDTSIGDYQFAWDVADAVLAQGVYPDTIATDMEIHSGRTGTGEPLVLDRRVSGARVASERSLLEYTAMFFKLGFSLDDVVRMTTQTPARVLRIEDRAGSLGVGMPADVSVLKATEGEYKLTDATGVSRVGNLALEPVVTLKAGAICPVSSGTHEWGFAPPRATVEEVAALA